MEVYKFRLNEDWSHRHVHFEGIAMENDWYQLSGGLLRIKKGYAWDGCTPKRYVLGLGTIGAPDGAMRYGLPWTYHASLVHDVLCQFRDEIPLSKWQVLTIFREQLTEMKFPLCALYVWVVDHFGPQDFLGQKALA